MTRNFAYFLFPLGLLTFISVSQCSDESERKGSSMASSIPNLPLLPSVFPGASDPNIDYDEDIEEPLHDIEELEALLGGPLENRRFVSVSKTSSYGGGKSREVTYKFRTREKRDSIRELKHDKQTHPKNLNETMLEQLMKTPEGFNSNTIYYHATHSLTALERIQETNASIGSPCEAKSLLDHDFCERAPYPNKNKMVCNKVMKYNKTGVTIEPNTCTCKFYRESENGHWVQMRRGTVTLGSGEEVDACLVPAYGVCDHRLPTGLKDIHNNNVYEVDICKGHYQCDNTKYLKYLKDKVKGPRVRNHCTEDDFLNLFKPKVRAHILLCAKPHPRRFSEYDEFKYYCLPKKSRDPEQWQFKKVVTEEAGQSKDEVFEY